MSSAGHRGIGASRRGFLAGAVALAGCVAPRHPVPEALVEAATLPGYDAGIRFWGDDADSIGRAAITSVGSTAVTAATTLRAANAGAPLAVRTLNISDHGGSSCWPIGT